jgi:hypothetical protein
MRTSSFPLVFKGEGEIAAVSRVVPGKLVYVETKHNDSERTYAVKLNQILVRKPDGSFCNYRGEPLSQIGVSVGREVVIMSDPDQPYVLIAYKGPGKASAILESAAKGLRLTRSK